VPRRVNLPAADDLFRPTVSPDDKPRRVRAVPDSPESQDSPEAETGAPRKPSGRIRHDEKMTVYVTSEELLEIEHARLALRSGQGLAVDRGRLMREAIMLVLADYQAKGDDSALVRRLTEE
jgi:hypothetical protein